MQMDRFFPSKFVAVINSFILASLLAFLLSLRLKAGSHPIGTFRLALVVTTFGSSMRTEARSAHW